MVLSWGFFLSFLGSLPPGAISMATVEVTVKRGLASASLFALGAAAVEFFQSLLALYFSQWILENLQSGSFFAWLSIPIFLGIGLHFFSKEPGKQAPLTDPARVPAGKAAYSLLGGGMLISGLNMLAIPFWVFYGTSLSGGGLIDLTNFSSILWFSAGVSLGTFLVLLGYAQLGQWAQKRAPRLDLWASRIAGATFFGVAASQVISLIQQA